jgi:hypothetical protein
MQRTLKVELLRVSYDSGRQLDTVIALGHNARSKVAQHKTPHLDVDAAIGEASIIIRLSMDDVERMQDVVAHEALEPPEGFALFLQAVERCVVAKVTVPVVPDPTA